MSPDVRQLLAAIRNALDVPIPAVFDTANERAYTRLLASRGAYVCGVLQGAVAGEPVRVASMAETLRGVDAHVPVTYTPYQRSGGDQ